MEKSKKCIELKFDEKDFIVDMFKSTCIIIKDKLRFDKYIFTHVAFKHYFIAYFIAHLIKEEEYKKDMINYIFDKEGFEYNLIYEILFDEDPLFLEKEIIVPILEEIKSVTQYKRLDILSSFQLFCKYISEKKFKGNKKNALNINVDIFLQDLFQKYEKKHSFDEFLKIFIKKDILNADITTYKYFDNLFEEIIFADDMATVETERNILPLTIKINTQIFFNKASNTKNLDDVCFSKPEITTLKSIFFIYFFLMHILEKIKSRHDYQKKYLERILKSKDY